MRSADNFVGIVQLNRPRFNTAKQRQLPPQARSAGGGASLCSVSKGGQSKGSSYQHSMRAPSQSPADAKTASQKFISGQEAAAKKEQGKMPSSVDGLKSESLTSAGNAMHTATDGTSPAHTDSNGDPKVWSGLAHPAAAYRHSQAEAAISNAQMDTAVNAAQEVFRATYGDDLYQQAIKTDGN